MSETAKRLEKADKYLQKGKLSSALEELRHVLLEEPGNDYARQRAADVSMSLGETGEAIRYLTELFDHSAAHNRGADAIGHYKKLVRLGPVDTDRTFKYAQLI